MSSKFKNQAAGVFWPPEVCISKLVEALPNAPVGMTCVVQLSGNGVGLLGPWTCSQTIRMRRFALHEEFQSNLVPTPSGTWCQALVQPAAGINPILVHIAFFPNNEAAPAYWSGDTSAGNYEPGVQFTKRISEWEITHGSGRGDARVWIA